MRLDKYLSLAQVGTRKKVKEYIYQGDVQVNGEVVRIPAMEVEEGKDCITYQGRELSQIERVCYMFHKPKGCITTKIANTPGEGINPIDCEVASSKSQEDYGDDTRTTVFDYLTGIDTTGLFAVGRLDRDTEGLLLITNDGDLNHRLMDPRHHVEKTYYFWVFGSIDEEGMGKIRQGMDIGDGEWTSPGKIEIVMTGRYTDLQEEMRQDGCTVVKRNLHRQEVTAGFLTISEGKKHQVKRMMRCIGCYVVYLKRVAIGNLQLDKDLPRGAYRELGVSSILEK